MQGKIFGIGFQKTGTTSLRDALDLSVVAPQNGDQRPGRGILYPVAQYGQRILDGYDAAEDTPWYKIFRELDVHFPGSKFILTEREPESWYRSVARHIGNLRSATHEWVYGRGKGLPKDDKENTLRVYNTHSEAVREYFKDRPEDLLILDFTQGEGWEKLCTFLGKDIPQDPFPHRNNSAAPKKKKSALAKQFKHSRQQFKSSLKIAFIDLMGWWPKEK
ncbi:MAG: sulfotransferase family protein [Bacteroidota bacterium]